MAYNIEQDHQAIKTQIKQWEEALDRILVCLADETATDHYDCVEELQSINHEMMAINL